MTEDYKQQSKKVADYYNQMQQGYNEVYGDTIQAFRPTGKDELMNHIAASVPNLPRDHKISIYLTSLNQGSYNVSLSTNKVRYIDEAGYELGGAAGTVTITSNSNSKLSGNFAIKLINLSSDTTLLNGSFSNILLHP